MRGGHEGGGTDGVSGTEKGIVKRGAVVWLGALSVAGEGDVGSVEKGKTTSAV